MCTQGWEYDPMFTPTWAHKEPFTQGYAHNETSHVGLFKENMREYTYWVIAKERIPGYKPQKSFHKLNPPTRHTGRVAK